MIPTDADAIDLLTAMVRTPGLCGDEDAVAAVLADAMTRFGFREVHRDQVGNVVGEVGPVDAPRSLLILGHLDTVPGEIPVEVRDGALYGRGAVDARGPLTAGVVAAARAAATTSLRVTAIGAVQEEGPSAGARHLATLPAPDMLVIAEPSGWDAVVLGYKGSQRFTAAITVPTTHSATPEPTASELAFDLWRRIAGWCEAQRPPEGREAGTFHRLTATLTRTGWEDDGLRETASLTIGLRLPPEIEVEWVRGELRRLAPEARLSFSPGEPAVRAERTTPLVGGFTRAIRAEGAVPRYKLKTGTSDMNVVLPRWRCPAMAYGPGDSRLDHTPEEHVRLEEYLSAVRVLTRVLEGM